MSDSRRDYPTPNKLRFRISGGVDDLKEVEQLIKSNREAKGWDLNWYRLAPRGDFGPLHDLELGFIESFD